MLCYAVDEDITTWVDDRGKFIDVRFKAGKILYRLDISRVDTGFHIQDLVSDAYSAGGRGKGVGTLLVNTAIQYLQSLDVDESTTLDGYMYAAPSDVSDQHALRKRFWARWQPDGDQPGEDPDHFRYRLTRVQLVDGRPVFGRYPSSISLDAFRSCKHDGH
jgi:hypothetical protein